MKKKMTIIFLIVCFYGQLQIVIAQENSDSSGLRVDSLNKVEKDLDESSLWIIRLGYFPKTNDIFISPGLAFSLGSEYQINKYFNFGWQAQLLKTFENEGDKTGMALLFALLDHDFKISDELFFIRGGGGLIIVSGGITSGGLLEFEYVLYSSGGVALSISISETFFQFKYLNPPVISIGIIF
jgi:hypothetical protein